jgi:hypothetical protein
MPSLPILPCLAATDGVKHRVSSALVEGFSQWWQMPLLIAVLVAVTAWVAWMYRRDAAELPRGVGLLLLGLRLGALATLAAAYLDLERIAEHEVVFPSRVAIVVDASASMTLPEGLDPGVEAAGGVAPTRSARAVEVLERGGVLAALAPTHEVSVWRFDADAESLAVLPRTAAGGIHRARRGDTRLGFASYHARPSGSCHTRYACQIGHAPGMQLQLAILASVSLAITDITLTLQTCP